MNIRKAFSLSEWRENGGIYHLVLSLQEPRGLRVGSLGLQSFPIGYYVYPVPQNAPCVSAGMNVPTSM